MKSKKRIKIVKELKLKTKKQNINFENQKLKDKK